MVRNAKLEDRDPLVVTQGELRSLTARKRPTAQERVHIEPMRRGAGTR
jgi:hypothetical protein